MSNDGCRFTIAADGYFYRRLETGLSYLKIGIGIGQEGLSYNRTVPTGERRLTEREQSVDSTPTVAVSETGPASFTTGGILYLSARSGVTSLDSLCL